MAKYPNSIKEREERNLRLGIKSSLPHLRNVIASLYCIYVVANKPSHIIYAEEYDNDGNKALKLISSFTEAIKRDFESHPDVVSLVSSSPLFTSQIEALQVGLELFFHLAKVNFVKSGLSERTGNSRYQKEIFFSTNMLQLDVILSCYDKAEVESFLIDWLNDEKHESKLENDIQLLLSIFSEDTQCKIRTTDGKEIYFQREGIYEALKEDHSVISEDAKELVGPYRILKSYIGSGMHPYLSDESKTFHENPMHSTQFQAYAEMVSTMLDLNPRRQTIIQEELLEKVGDFESASHENFPLQRIYYGAPGTGKSYKIDGHTNDDNSIRMTFHPDTDYATFVGAYKPMMDVVDEYALDATGKTHKIDYPSGKSSIIYKYEPQVFLKAYVEAWKRYLNKQEGEDDSYYLVIEEINRGNCAQIFGDLFQLLDREDDGYSSYAISPESAITKYLAEEVQSADGTKFSDLVFSDVIKKRKDGATKIIATADDLKAGKRLVLPPNLHIWATMNTSDQSLFPIDSAFKRRWDWKYVSIKRADKEPEKKWIIKVAHDGKTYWCYWWEFLEAINHQIEETTHSEDKQLGNFFAKPKAGEDFISTDTFVNKVIFYLWNDVFKDEDSAVFQYDNDKVEDVSISRSGTMYFRHFMENTDEMIHYFINQLFAMGKESTPVVPIDYLKNDADPKVFEHLPKMREDCEETPMPKKDKGEENAENDKVAGEVDGKSVDTCNFSNDTYKAIAEHIDRNSWMNDKTREYFRNGVDVKFTDMPISYARFPITFDSSKNQAEIKLYIPSPSAYNKSGELYTYLKGLGVENIVQTLSTKFQFEWHELGDQNPQSNKVKGWALTLGVDYNNDAVLIANQIISLASEFFYNVDSLISSFINIQR